MRSVIEMDDIGARVAVLTEKVRALEAELSSLITKEEFAPVKLLVYGMTGLMLMAVMTAILALVLKG